MNETKYRRILYFISLVILLTFCVQGYWSYKNYLSEKQQFINDVQLSLDNAMEMYYNTLAKQNVFALAKGTEFSNDLIIDVASDSLNSIWSRFEIPDSSEFRQISMFKSTNQDSLRIQFDDHFPVDLKGQVKISTDSLSAQFKMLTSKIIVSFSEDTLSIKSIDSLIHRELQRKNIDIEYGLRYLSHFRKAEELRTAFIKSSPLSVTTNSPFLENHGSLELFFENNTLLVLKRNAVSLLLSFILLASVIACLLYLLKVIKNQKQLAAIKNDLISNITHEFKTPLSTISVALEGIQRFNGDKNPEKSLQYADMSRKEVEKLTLMVEKLLETATLDSDRLALNLEETDLVPLVEKASILPEDMLHGKHLTFRTDLVTCMLKVDQFHFTNALNNMIDNALKYGGNEIQVNLNRNIKGIEISIKDNGTSFSRQQANKIFEKFYRVPKGNTHDVKGFGIGLYYTKNIIEKHGGTIEVFLKEGTEFLISLPHE